MTNTFSDLSIRLLQLEQTPSRLQMTEQLAALFSMLGSQEIQPVCYLLQGSLVPQYESLEFQMSVKMVIRALARFVVITTASTAGVVVSDDLFGEVTTSEQDIAQITSQYKKLGDIGLVAEEVVATFGGTSSAAALSIEHVFAKLTSIAKAGGAGSQEQKVQGLFELFQELDTTSARYVARIVIGKLRLGFSTMTMLDALSWAVVGDKSEAAELELLYQKQADIGVLASEYLQLRTSSSAERFSRLQQQIRVTVGVPVVPALCQRLNSSEEIIAKMNTIIIEPKYDGLRVQIHLKKTEPKVSVFTRNLENVSDMFPELQDISSRLLVESCILDAEAIGYNKTTDELLPFQDTITRRRKHDVGEKAVEVPIRFYVFDVLAIGETEFLTTPLQERKDALKKLFDTNEVLLHAPYEITDSVEKTRSLHHQFLAEGLEGAVMKQVDSHYISGRKGWSWVKIKEAEGRTGKLTDTLDCIIMGYYAGRGKRSAFGMGALLVGVKDGTTDSVFTIAKIGTGISDAQLQSIKKLCDEHAVDEAPKTYVVDQHLKPDVWVAAALVVEIAADELTNSPIHSAKVALRFPRLVRVREDKSWEQATTKTELADISIAG